MAVKKPLERARGICLALPEATEKLSHGEPTWFIGKKVFAGYDDHHHGGPIEGLQVGAPDGMQTFLMRAQPDRFYVPKYVGHRGWIGINMEGAVDWAHVDELVRQSYRMIAPKRLAALVDAGDGASPEQAAPKKRSSARRTRA